MSEKIIFSKLTQVEKKELYNFLLEYEIDYRKSLGFDKKSSFGLEIEVVAFEKYEERKNPIPWLFADVESLYPTSYDVWWLVKELGLTEEENEYGYEVISPILNDSEKTWKEVVQIFQGINKMNYISNDLCSAHIHFGIDLMNKEKILALLKVWSIYEDIIYRFSYGEFCNARSHIIRYANPISLYTKDMLATLPDESTLLSILMKLPSGHSSGLNLSNYRNVLLDLNNAIKTIEVRCPNGTLNPIIWQNNINTFGKLLEFIYEDKYDQEDLDYKLNKNILSYEETFNYSQIDFEKALEFADLIFDDNIDKINFLKQYIKDDNVQKEGKLQKTLSFTKKNLHY